LKLDGPENISDKDPDPFSVSHIKGFRSAVVHLYTRKNMKLHPELDREMSRMIDGYDKVINDLKKAGLMKPNEGKRALKFEGYSYLCRALVKLVPSKNGSWSLCSFMWSYFTLLWNLMSRSDSISTLMEEHFDWEGDAMLVQEQGHKADQSGKEKYWKHIYANPVDPIICPILALAVHIFSIAAHSTHVNHKIFDGTNNKDRFGRNLAAVLSKFSEEEMHNMGSDAKQSDFGTHSARKGAGSFCLGQVAGPNPITVTLRMGHSLGKIKDKYIFHCEGGDQLCGRMVNGSDFSSEMFAVLPPHFLAAADAILTSEFWNNAIPGYDKKPSGFRAILPYLLASLLYHEEFLRAELSENHPIFRSRIFTQCETLPQLRPMIRLGVGRCPHTGMQATGIPPHLAISAKVNDLIAKIEALEAKVNEQREYMETTLPKNLSTQVVDDLRQNFEVTGVLPVTLKDFQALMTNVTHAINNQHDQFHEIMEKRLKEVERLARGEKQAGPSPDGEWLWAQYQWADCSTHMVPEGWRLPTQVPVKAAYDWWFHGDKATGIQPYCNLKRADISSADVMRLTRMRRVITELCLRMDLPEGITSPSQLTIVDSDSCFTAAYDKLMADVLQVTNIKRPNDWSYGSAYNAILKLKKLLF
jgi:hypothetical protein